MRTGAPALLVLILGRSLSGQVNASRLVAGPDSLSIALARSGGDVVTLSGAELRRSGASSLGEALLGKVPGMSWQVSSGAFGSLPAITLRGTSTLLTATNPLVVVDGVAVSAMLALPGSFFTGRPEPDAEFARVTDFPLADIAHVSVIRGATAVAAYGPRASAGAVVITTVRPAAGFHAAISQRVGVSTRDEVLRSRIITREEAANNLMLSRSPVATVAAARVASWDSCAGFCDTEGAIFGGTRPLGQTMARIDGGSQASRGALSLVNRHAGLPVRGTADEFRSGRLVVQQDVGSRLTVTGSHLIQRTEGNHPLQDGTGPSIDFGLGTLWVPTWQNLRGVAGYYADTTVLSRNPLTLVGRVPTPRRVTQYVTQGAFRLSVMRQPALSISLQATGGRHRLTQRDQAMLTAVTSDPEHQLTRYAIESDVDERSTDVSVSVTRTLSAGAVVGSAGYLHQRWQQNRREVFDSRSPLTRASDLEHAYRGWYATGGWLGPDLQLTLSARQDTPAGVGRDPGAQRSAMVAGAAPVLRAAWGTIGLRGSAARLEIQSFLPLYTSAGTFHPGYSREERRDYDGGVVVALGRNRSTLAINAYQSRSGHVAPPANAASGVFAGTLQARGMDARLTVHAPDDARLKWSVGVMAGRSNSRFLAGDSFDSLVVPLGHEALQRVLAPAASLTAITLTTSGRIVGDVAPRYVFSQAGEVAWKGWRLTTQVDGEQGGDMVNFAQIIRDRSRLSPLPDGGAARSQAADSGEPVYVQDGSYAILREVVLSREVGQANAWLPAGARLEVAGRNLLLLSRLEGYDPSARRFGSLNARSSAQNIYPRMRSVAVSIVVGF